MTRRDEWIAGCKVLIGLLHDGDVNRDVLSELLRCIENAPTADDTTLRCDCGGPLGAFYSLGLHRCYDCGAESVISK